MAMEKSVDKKQTFKDLIKDKMAQKMGVRNLVDFNTEKNNKLLDILNGADDCVLTLYLSTKTMIETVPSNEFRKFKADDQYDQRMKGVINFLA